MRFPVDLKLFDQTTHTPSLFTLERSMGGSHGQIRDYCIPVNSYFPTAEMMELWQNEMPRALKYYPADNRQIAQLVAGYFGLNADEVVMFNGATELLSWVTQTLIPDQFVTPIPTFGRWTDVPKQTGKRVVPIVRRAEKDYRLHVSVVVETVRASRASAVVICNPNNPTGACMSRLETIELLEQLSDLSLVVVDESFLDFSDMRMTSSVVDLVDRYRNLLVMKSLGKNLGLHGLRIGYSVANAALSEELRRYVPHWNVNALAEMVLRSLGDFRDDYEASRRRVIEDREFLFAQLSQLKDLRAFPSMGNFVFCHLPDRVDGDTFRNRLLTEWGYLVRHCGNKWGATAQQLRIVARPGEETTALVKAMNQILTSERRSDSRPLGPRFSLPCGAGGPVMRI